MITTGNLEKPIPFVVSLSNHDRNGFFEVPHTANTQKSNPLTRNRDVFSGTQKNIFTFWCSIFDVERLTY